jgi:hypothetical protein
MHRTGLRPITDINQSRPLRRARKSAWHLQREQRNVAGNIGPLGLFWLRAQPPRSV